MKNKKAQMNQMFIYIMTILVLGLVFFMGYKYVAYFKENSDKIADAKVQKQLTNDVSRLLGNYGSTLVYNQKNPFSVPSQYIEICFADTLRLDSQTITNIPPGEYSLMFDSICGSVPISSQACDRVHCADCASNNVFLILEKNGVKDMDISYFVDKLTVGFDHSSSLTSGWICIPVNKGKSLLKLESKGKFVNVDSI